VRGTERGAYLWIVVLSSRLGLRNRSDVPVAFHWWYAEMTDSVHSAGSATCEEAHVTERRPRWGAAAGKSRIALEPVVTGNGTEKPDVGHLPKRDGERVRTWSSDSNLHVTPIGGSTATPISVEIAAPILHGRARWISTSTQYERPDDP
jgi:hypothetical protein